MAFAYSKFEQLHYLFHYLAILNRPQMCWPYAKSIVPVPSIANAPTKKVAFTCAINKYRYLFRSTKQSAIKYSGDGGRLLFRGRATSRIYGHVCNKPLRIKMHVQITKKRYFNKSVILVILISKTILVILSLILSITILYSILKNCLYHY